MSQLPKSPWFINSASCSKIALAQTRPLVLLVFLALFAVSPATSGSPSSKACDSGDSDEEAGDNQAFLQHSTTNALKKASKERKPFKILKKVGACRQNSGQFKMWFGKIQDVGNKTAADCWNACQESGAHTADKAFSAFGNDGLYASCYCTSECKCMLAMGVSNTLVPADFSGRVPSACSDCPQLGGTYHYTGPGADPKGVLEIKQKGCYGTVSGQGRFTSVLDNAGANRVLMQTASGSMVAHGMFKKEAGLRSIAWDNGYVYQEHDTRVDHRALWGREQEFPASRLHGWDALGTTMCAAGAYLFRGTPIPSRFGGYGKSCILSCAHYATTNEATYFSYSSCPPPYPKFEQQALSCPGRGLSGCLNGNKAYSSFSQAWSACGIVEGCGVVMKWRNGKYFLRRSTDPVYRGRHDIGTSLLAMPYHCPEERKRCDIWNKCASVKQHTSFSAFQVACPSPADTCSGIADVRIGCPEPLCDIPPVPGFD
eukprot:TRINITY_DN42390_c0_g1_i1.p1 TRINITY_DN42390_c0_g1~~TRINITY_DN42390_c0_g1_i1.p1  ORF type:complete len:485 (-),score=56.21 TRINITY_DN42390_c0_g1_i1:172-1626(-)